MNMFFTSIYYFWKCKEVAIVEDNFNTMGDTVEIDLGELFHAIWEKIWGVLAVTVLCAAAAGNITYFLINPTYSATSRIYLLPRETASISQAELQVGTQMTSDAAKLAKSQSVVEPVIRNLKLDRTYDDLAGAITIDNPTDTRLIDITVQDQDPQLAADISNALANSLCDQIATIMKTDRPTIAEKATATYRPSAPSMTKNVVIAALLGLFASVALILIRFIRDDTIKTQEDVQNYLHLNTLASIPLEYSDDSSFGFRRKLRRDE